MSEEIQPKPMDDCYSCAELIALYQETGSVDAAVLNQAARAKFTDRVKAPDIRVEEGIHGRWFPLNEERTEFAAPQYTIKGGRGNWVGIMEDGTIHSY